MAESLSKELSALQPMVAAIATAKTNLLKVVQQEGGEKAAVVLAKCIQDTGSEEKMGPLVAVLDGAMRDDTDVGPEFRENMESFLAATFKKIATLGGTGGTSVKDAKKKLKGWKSSGFVTSELQSSLKDILEGKEEKKPAAEGGSKGGGDEGVPSAGGDAAAEAPGGGAGGLVAPKVVTVAEAEHQISTLNQLVTDLKKLPAVRRDQYVTRIEAFKKGRGAARRMKRDQQSLEFLEGLLKEVAAEVESLVSITGGTHFGDDDGAASSPLGKRGGGPRSFQEFLEEKMNKNGGSDNNNSSSNNNYLPGANSNNNTVPIYGTTRTLATSLLDSDVAKHQSLSKTARAEIPRTGEGTGRIRYPYTVARRSPFILKADPTTGATVETTRYSIQWSPLSHEWESKKDLSDIPVVAEVAPPPARPTNTTTMSGSTTTAGATDPTTRQKRAREDFYN